MLAPLADNTESLNMDPGPSTDSKGGFLQPSAFTMVQEAGNTGVPEEWMSDIGGSDTPPLQETTLGE